MADKDKILRKYIDKYLKEVAPAEFYRDVFPQGSLADRNLKEKQKYAGLIYPKDRLNRYVNNDLETVLACDKSMVATMNCVSYAGSGETPDLARELYAFVFRVLLPDEIRPGYIQSCLHDLELQAYAPYSAANPQVLCICPTYIVTDYNEVYFYYLLHEPLPLYHSLHKQIQRLYDAFSRAIHRFFDLSHFDEVEKKRVYTYECRKPRPGSFLAPFPVVGTRGKTEIFRAYKMGKKYDIEDLNAAVPKDCAVNLFSPTLSLEEAKEKFPKWYKRRIVQRRKTSGKRVWTSSEKLYDWFLKLANDNIEKVEPGVLEALASYACKTDIRKYKFYVDLDDLSNKLESRFPKDTIAEHKDRARAFFEDCPMLLAKWGIEAVEKWSGLTIKRNLRKGRTQKEHLKLVNAKQTALSRKEDVRVWQKEHPDAKQIDCSRALKISPKTVSKWWVRPSKAKYPCPNCGAPMERIKVGPWFWEQKGKYCARIDKKCPECNYEIKGRVYYPK